MAVPIRVILNPTAGGGGARRRRERVERELAERRLEYTIRETERPGHAVELARAAADEGAEIVVAAGGDGTIHEVANGLLTARDGAPSEPALGIVPIGTGNDFAKIIEGSTQGAGAFDIIAEGTVRRFDVGRVEWPGGGEFFINGMGTGIDVEVVRQLDRLPNLPGVLGYLIGLLKGLVRFRPIPLRLRLDGVPLERTVMIAAVGNGPCLGGGFYLCPDARADDGRFDICIVNELNYVQIARTIPRIMRGAHTEMPEVEMRQATTIDVEAMGDAPLYFHLDGELREPAEVSSFRVELRAGALPVLSPGAGGGR